MANFSQLWFEWNIPCFKLLSLKWCSALPYACCFVGGEEETPNSDLNCLKHLFVCLVEICIAGGSLLTTLFPMSSCHGCHNLEHCETDRKILSFRSWSVADKKFLLLSHMSLKFLWASYWICSNTPNVCERLCL